MTPSNQEPARIPLLLNQFAKSVPERRDVANLEDGLVKSLFVLKWVLILRKRVWYASCKVSPCEYGSIRRMEIAMLSNEQVKRYLERIGYEGELRHDVATLDGLVRHHQCSVPFETITLRQKTGAPPLDLQVIYEKVVEYRLGGYCFELNLLFDALLRALGFDVRPILCRSVERDGIRVPINHRGELVSLDGRSYFVEVGYGGPVPSGALPLDDCGDQLINGETFRMIRLDETWWCMERARKEKLVNPTAKADSLRIPELELCIARVYDLDFLALNEYLSLPGTLFRDHTIVNLRTQDGHKSIFDDVFKVRKGRETEVIEIKTRHQLQLVLENEFGMKVAPCIFA